MGHQNSLGFLGGMLQINQTGTEYCFEDFCECYEDRFEGEGVLECIAEAAEDFPLAESAREMGEIFRVNEAVFNDGEDREQEIDNGHIRRCEMYEAFCSFVWTLADCCGDTAANEIIP